MVRLQESKEITRGSNVRGGTKMKRNCGELIEKKKRRKKGRWENGSKLTRGMTNSLKKKIGLSKGGGGLRIADEGCVEEVTADRLKPKALRQRGGDIHSAKERNYQGKKNGAKGWERVQSL